MYNTIGIQNFRAFDSNGCSIPVRQLTIFTGTNSSGKSSFVKGILLLNDFLEQFKAKGVIEECVLDFSRHNYLLGTFSNVLNDKASDDDVITFSYDTPAEYFDGNLQVSVSFKPLWADDKQQAWFDRIKVCYDNQLLIEISKGDRHSNEQDPEYKFDARLLREMFLSLVDGSVKENDARDESGKYRPFPTLILNDAGENEDTLCTIHDRHSIFVFPSLDIVGGFNWQELDAYLSARPDGSDWSEIVPLFKESGYSRFDEYFHSLERECFETFSVSVDEWSRRYGSVTTMSKLHDHLSLGGYTCSFPDETLDSDAASQRKVQLLYALCFLHHLSCGHDFYSPREMPPTYSLFVSFVGAMFRKAMEPRFGGGVRYVPSDKVAIKRLYSLEDEGDAFQKLLVSYFATKDQFGREKKEFYPEYVLKRFRPGAFINKWVRQFGIGHRLSIEKHADGLGVLLRLYKDPKDRKGVLLADEGYGISQLISLLISAEICVMKGFLARKDVNSYFGRDLTLLVEEPEIHLHPRLQSLLADVFWELLSVYYIHVIVETHSEYLVRKLQVLCAKKAKKARYDDEMMAARCPVAVWYFEKGKGAYNLEMRSDGKFRNDFGSGFYDEAGRLVLSIL